VADFRVAAAAETQLGDILGARHAARAVAAMADVAGNTRLPGIVWQAVAGQRVGVYRVDAGAYLVLRAGTDGVVDILGLIPAPALNRRALQRVLRAGPRT
jgi:hypothetical protein